MTDNGDSAALAQSRAAAGRRAFPQAVWLHPVFCPVERAGNRWRILGPAEPAPQQARDALAQEFTLRAACAPAGSVEAGDYGVAADLLNREGLRRLTVAGRPFAIARLEQFLRTGPDGPQPARPGDERLPAGLDGPPAVRFIGDDDTCFAVVERAGDRWQQAWPGEYQTPDQARAALIAYLRGHTAPRGGYPTSLGGAYAQAADGLARCHVSDVAVAGHQFRITRVERTARMDPRDSCSEGPHLSPDLEDRR